MKRVLALMVGVMLLMGLVACSSTTNGNSNGDSNGTTTSATTTGTTAAPITDPAGDLEWPAESLPDYVPEIVGVSITAIIDTAQGMSIKFDGCNKDIADAFTQAIQDAGWKIVMNTDQAGGFKTIMATNDDAETLQFAWRDSSRGDGTITYIGS